MENCLLDYFFWGWSKALLPERLTHVHRYRVQDVLCGQPSSEAVLRHAEGSVDLLV